MKKKDTELEADLDPAGTRHTRPGGKIAESALANAKPKPTSARKRTTAGEPSRPGATAAARAVEATKAKKKRTSTR